MVQSVQKSSIDQAAWTSWTPTYASDVGSANTTYTGPGVVSTGVARCKVNGKSLFLNINFSGLLNAVTPTYLSATLPSGYTLQSSGLFTPAVLRNNGTYETGILTPQSTGELRFYRAGFATFTSSGLVTAAASAVLELA